MPTVTLSTGNNLEEFTSMDLQGNECMKKRLPVPNILEIRYIISPNTMVFLAFRVRIYHIGNLQQKHASLN